MDGRRKGEGEIPRLAYSVTEAALALGINKVTLEMLIRTGRIPTVPLTRKRMISVEVLRNFLLGKTDAEA
jgi:excisionase family DNA binding protein